MSIKDLPLYKTDLGQAYVGDALHYLAEVEDSTIDLVIPVI